MAKAYDIPSDDLIAMLAEQLKKDKKIEPPSWAAFVKTGAHVEKIPQNRDWWYTRCASLLRKIYIHGPIGISEIGYNLSHHKDAGGAVIRKALHQLEAAGYIVKKNKGRLISDEGMKRIDRLATEFYKEIIKSSPELQRYA
jgi:small subunit ribosomal protein S19e